MPPKKRRNTPRPKPRAKSSNSGPLIAGVAVVVVGVVVAVVVMSADGETSRTGREPTARKKARGMPDPTKELPQSTQRAEPAGDTVATVKLGPLGDAPAPAPKAERPRPTPPPPPPPPAAPSKPRSKPAAPEDAIWVEGERPTVNKMNRHSWYDSVKRDALSGGAMTSNFNKDKEGYAEYEVDVKESDTFTFWVRANPLHASLSYKIDDGAWQSIDMNKNQRGNMNIARNNKPDLRFIAWAKVGKVKLAAGKHTVAFKMHSKNNNHGYLDCFTFVRIPFVPSGVGRPVVIDESSIGPGDWFPVVYDEDAFSEQSVIDMTKYVEAPAGKHGFLERDGADLKFERGAARVRFWGCGGNLNDRLSRKEQTTRIRYLRKHGVNMIRQHPLIGYLGPLKNGKIDADKLDRWDWWFAELKKHGIYMTWSVFYPHHGPFITKEDNYELWDELQKKRGLGNAGGLINFSRGLQDACLRYLSVLLNHTNKYTGLKYKDDPALAVLEIQNEDCIFFHVPLNDLRDPRKTKFPKHAKMFRQMFGAWLKKTYGSESALKQAWGSLRGGDSWANGEFETMGAYHLGGDGPMYEFKGQNRRAGDFIHFCADVQKEYYDRREKEMRSLGFKGVTVTTAWCAGGAAADPANLFCDTACDMIDRHNYFGGGDGGHRIAEGKVGWQSHLAKPGSGLLGLGMYQVHDRPFCVTEWSMMPPNQWKLEAAPLYAFYGLGLQGWDASYHFLNSRMYPGDGWPGLSKYCTDTPHYIGQFPALAFAVYHNHVKEAPAVAHRRVSQDELYQGTDPLKQDFTGGGHDIKTIKSSGVTPIEALAAGRITVSFEDGEDEFEDLSALWNTGARTIRSVTGELEWNYGKELVTVRTPKTQALIGRAAGAAIDLPGARVTVRTPFVSLILTPLDDADLASSKHVLVTAMARDRQTGTRYSSDGQRLTTIGAPPLLMEPVQATIALKGGAPSAVNVLDVYGVPTGKRVEVNADGSFAISGKYRTFYYEVKR